MKDTYIEAIDCLAKIDNINYRDIILYIAKNHPRVLIKACQKEIPLTPHEKGSSVCQGASEPKNKGY